MICLASNDTYDPEYLIVKSAYCVNRSIYEKAINSLPTLSEILHIPESVDVDRFNMKDRPKELIVGWAGNESRYGKNFDFVKSVQEKSGLPFRFALASDPLNRLEMQDFYDSISVLLVCSDSEGGPRTSIEAGACGVPTLCSCKLSSAYETIVDNYDGFLCDHSVNSVVSRLIYLRDNYDDIIKAGIRFRKTVEAKHDFKLNTMTIERMLFRLL